MDIKCRKARKMHKCEHKEDLGTNINAHCFNLDELNVPRFSSFQCSCSVVSNSLWPHWLQNARLPCPSPTLRACSNSCPSRRCCHLAISSSVIAYSSHLPSFPASEFFPMSQLFTSGGQSIGSLILASVLPMNILDWFPFGLTGLISLQSRRLSGVFCSTTVQRHQFFFGAWPLFLGCALLGSRQKAQVFIKAHLTLWDFRFSLQQRWLRIHPVIPSASQPAAALGQGEDAALAKEPAWKWALLKFYTPDTSLASS